MESSLKTGNHVAVCVQGPADVNELLRGERRSDWLTWKKFRVFFFFKEKKLCLSGWYKEGKLYFLDSNLLNLLLSVANRQEEIKWLISFLSWGGGWCVCVRWLNHKFSIPVLGKRLLSLKLSFIHLAWGKGKSLPRKHISALLKSLSRPKTRLCASQVSFWTEQTCQVPAAGGGRSWQRKAAALSSPLPSSFFSLPPSEGMNHAPTTAKKCWKLGEHWCRTKKASGDVPAQTRREWLYFIIFFPFALCCH